MTYTFSAQRLEAENQLAGAGKPSHPTRSSKAICRYSSGNTWAKPDEQNLEGLPPHFREFSTNHDFSASSEADNTRCKSGSLVSLPLLSSILSRINRDIYFSMRRHFAKPVPYKDKSNYFHCMVSCTFTFTTHICENKVSMFWNGSERVLITSQPHSTNCGRICVGLKHFEEF